MSELEQYDQCVYAEECRNACNAVKCQRCENNPYNFAMIKKYGEGQTHERRTRAFYNYTDNYDPL